jgi:hypothetical protein
LLAVAVAFPGTIKAELPGVIRAREPYMKLRVLATAFRR